MLNLEDMNKFELYVLMKKKKCLLYAEENYKIRDVLKKLSAMKGKLRSSILEVFQSALRENFSLTEEVDAHQKMNLIQ